jgi:hypothetical protein
MSNVATAWADSTIMLRRNLKHTMRNPLVLFNAILFPSPNSRDQTGGSPVSRGSCRTCLGTCRIPRE